MIDFRSDTVTKPTITMREAMYHAVVGDDGYGEDPTVNELEELGARMLGKEAALFVNSGTQGNQLAVLSYTRPGEEIILEEDSHLFCFEAGAVSSLAGVQTKTIKGKRGQMPLDTLEAAIQAESIRSARTSLITFENTHNQAGGAVLPIDYMQQVYELGKVYDIPVHLDGARIFNAAIALNVDVSELTKYTDTVQVCLSKGLCAPMGSLLAGPKDIINKARKWRVALGGSMRQGGVVAAPGIIALKEMVERLEEDHLRAQQLARGLQNIKELQINLAQVETNIVLLETKKLGLNANQFIKLLREHSILANSFGPFTVRLMTHRDVKEEDIEQAIKIIKDIVT